MFRPHIKIPVGSYVDIPDDTGKLERWLVILDDHPPQFPMYYVLKCNWVLKWVYEGKVYKCECVQRTQSSYNSGLWTDYNFTSVENQTLMWLPTTPYTQTLSYNQRVLINDEGRSVPIAWELSKVLDTIPLGVTRLTFKQVQADMHQDCPKYGLANWCSNDGSCVGCAVAEPIYIDAGLQMPEPESRKGRITYNGKDLTLRVGGSAKTFTAEYWDEEFKSYNVFWTISFIDGENVLCEFSAHYNGTWDITSPYDIEINGDKIKYKDIFDIKLVASGNSVKLSCGQLYSMVGKRIKLASKDEYNENDAEIIVEVIS